MIGDAAVHSSTISLYIPIALIEQYSRRQGFYDDGLAASADIAIYGRRTFGIITEPSACW